MDLKAIIFDLDGVLTDTAHFHFIAWRDMAKSIGIIITEEDNEQLKGLSRRDSLEKILEIGGGRDVTEQEKTELMNQKNEQYLQLLNDLKPSDTLIGVREFLEDAKEQGIPMAVGSASKNAKQIVNKLELTDYFETIIDGTMVTNSKPDPEVFLLAADEMNVSPQNTVVFEDAIAGIQAANSGGFFSVGVGDEKSLNQAQSVIPNMDNFTINSLKNIIEST